MFFSTYVLTKKGPLAKVWLAAHWDRKLTRNEVRVINLQETVIHIIQPIVPIAIRTSGELLIGVVRIYALKVKHLLREATDASLLLLVAGQGKTTINDKSDQQTSKNSSKAVTHDWSGRNFQASTEESQFNDIADLLVGFSKNTADRKTDEDLLKSAWYTIEPMLNVESNTPQDFDDIARMRADLIAFEGRRADSGSNSTKSKSSLSSIEKGRGSAEEVPFPSVLEELDIGVPLLDELPIQFPTFVEEKSDPFFIPELIAAEPLEADGRKKRSLNILDVAATTLPREVFEKRMADRSDIVEHYEARHGSTTEVEEDTRIFLAEHRSEATIRMGGEGDRTPLSAVSSPLLRSIYCDLLKCIVSAVPSGQPQEDVFDSSVLPSDEVLAASEIANASQSRKRTRESRDENGLSVNASLLLEKIKDTIDGRSRKQRKRKASSSCSFQELTSGCGRREAARTFVDMLSLISKQLVAVTQETTLGQLDLCLRPSVSTT